MTSHYQLIINNLFTSLVMHGGWKTKVVVKSGMRLLIDI